MKLLFISCLLFCISLNSNAQATHLVIENQKAGQLSNLISENDKKTVRNLKVSGPIDSRDLEFIGSLIRSYSLDGVLDLSECTIKKLKPLLSGDTKDSLRVYRIPKSASDVVSCAANLYVDTLYFECKVNFLNSQKIWWDEKNSVGKADIGHLYIGEGVDSIGNLMKDSGREWAGSCTSIKSVHLPSSLRYIGRDSFWGCGLNYCNFNDLINLEYIESSSGFNRGAIFDNCVLDTLVIPQKLTAFPLHTIRVKAPGGYVYIGKSTKSFPIRLSSTGSSIKRVSEGRTFYINQTTPPDFSTWFQKETVYVPKGAKKAYINAGWSDVEIIEMNPVEKVSISEHEIVFDKGQKHNLSVTITPEDADDKQIEWTSDNESVASVNKEGTVSAISSGQAIIYATSIATGIKDSCLVIVRKNVESITFENSEVILNSIGDSKQLVLVFSPTDATEKAVTWKSSNEQVCIVSASGIVTASGIGSAIITATTVDGGHTANCVVKVLQHVTGLSFEKNSISLKVGEKEQLKVEVKPDNADDKTVTWSSSNKQIASVDANGNVTALKAGDAWIKAVSVDNAEAKDSCKVTVTQPVTGVLLSKENYTFDKTGESVQLTATVQPEDASNKEVRWSSSNENVCIVQNGLVTAVAAGTATVMVTTIDGNFTANCIVKVVQHVAKVEMNKTTLTLKVGEEEKLTATVSPDNAENKSLTWMSSNEKIATVDANGNVKALKAGEAWIKAVSVDNVEAQDSCKVTVTQPVTGITLSKENYTFDKTRESVQLTATVLPEDASNKEVRWSSSNENVCIVQNGLVTAVASGTATITVTTVDGNFTANCIVKVVQHVAKVEMNKTSLTLKVGDEDRLTASVAPDNAENKALTWMSSNEKIATVDANGNVKALKAGEAWIKAVSIDNVEAKDSCKVTVTQPVTGITISQEAIKLTNIGENKQLEATVLPEDASNKEVKWKSSNESICMVANGKVIATGFGTAVVMVTTVDGGFMASSTVTVESENTVIESVEASVSEKPVYNMMGRKVTVLEKGRLYIRNGKKFIAK